jgi:hypothetical protein
MADNFDNANVFFFCISSIGFSNAMHQDGAHLSIHEGGIASFAKQFLESFHSGCQISHFNNHC